MFFYFYFQCKLIVFFHLNPETEACFLDITCYLIQKQATTQVDIREIVEAEGEGNTVTNGGDAM